MCVNTLILTLIYIFLTLVLYNLINNLNFHEDHNTNYL